MAGVARISLAPRLATLEGARLAFVSNRKRTVDALMLALAHAIRSREPSIEVKHFEKSSVYRAQPRRLVAELLEQADGVVVGPGD